MSWSKNIDVFECYYMMEQYVFMHFSRSRQSCTGMICGSRRMHRFGASDENYCGSMLLSFCSKTFLSLLVTLARCSRSNTINCNSHLNKYTFILNQSNQYFSEATTPQQLAGNVTNIEMDCGITSMT